MNRASARFLFCANRATQMDRGSTADPAVPGATCRTGRSASSGSWRAIFFFRRCFGSMNRVGVQSRTLDCPDRLKPALQRRGEWQAAMPDMAGIGAMPQVVRDSVKPTFYPATAGEANGVSILLGREREEARCARTAGGGRIGPTESRPTFRSMERLGERCRSTATSRLHQSGDQSPHCSKAGVKLIGVRVHCYFTVARNSMTSRSSRRLR